MLYFVLNEAGVEAMGPMQTLQVQFNLNPEFTPPFVFVGVLRVMAKVTIASPFALALGNPFVNTHRVRTGGCHPWGV